MCMLAINMFKTTAGSFNCISLKPNVFLFKLFQRHHLLDSLVVYSWLRVREVPGSIPSQGPRHTKDVIKIVPGS